MQIRQYLRYVKIQKIRAFIIIFRANRNTSIQTLFERYNNERVTRQFLELLTYSGKLLIGFYTNCPFVQEGRKNIFTNT